MPGQTDYHKGDLIGTRALVTIPTLSKGVYKTQFEIATNVALSKATYRNVSIGMRGVNEKPVEFKIPLTNTSFTIEDNAGFRLRFKWEKFVKKMEKLKQN